MKAAVIGGSGQDVLAARLRRRLPRRDRPAGGLTVAIYNKVFVDVVHVTLRDRPRRATSSRRRRREAARHDRRRGAHVSSNGEQASVDLALTPSASG
jgi:hypothetical protein